MSDDERDYARLIYGEPASLVEQLSQVPREILNFCLNREHPSIFAVLCNFVLWVLWALTYLFWSGPAIGRWITVFQGLRIIDRNPGLFVVLVPLACLLWFIRRVFLTRGEMDQPFEIVVSLSVAVRFFALLSALIAFKTFLLPKFQNVSWFGSESSLSDHLVGRVSLADTEVETHPGDTEQRQDEQQQNDQQGQTQTQIQTQQQPPQQQQQHTQNHITDDVHGPPTQRSLGSGDIIIRSSGARTGRSNYRRRPFDPSRDILNLQLPTINQEPQEEAEPNPSSRADGLRIIKKQSGETKAVMYHSTVMQTETPQLRLVLAGSVVIEPTELAPSAPEPPQQRLVLFPPVVIQPEEPVHGTPQTSRSEQSTGSKTLKEISRELRGSATRIKLDQELEDDDIYDATPREQSPCARLSNRRAENSQRPSPDYLHQGHPSETCLFPGFENAELFRDENDGPEKPYRRDYHNFERHGNNDLQDGHDEDGSDGDDNPPPPPAAGAIRDRHHGTRQRLPLGNAPLARGRRPQRISRLPAARRRRSPETAYSAYALYLSARNGGDTKIKKASSSKRAVKPAPSESPAKIPNDVSKPLQPTVDNSGPGSVSKSTQAMLEALNEVSARLLPYATSNNSDHEIVLRSAQVPLPPSLPSSTPRDVDNDRNAALEHVSISSSILSSPPADLQHPLPDAPATEPTAPAEHPEDSQQKAILDDTSEAPKPLTPRSQLRENLFGTANVTEQATPAYNPFLTVNSGNQGDATGSPFEPSTRIESPILPQESNASAQHQGAYLSDDALDSFLADIGADNLDEQTMDWNQEQETVFMEDDEEEIEDTTLDDAPQTAEDATLDNHTTDVPMGEKRVRDSLDESEANDDDVDMNDDEEEVRRAPKPVTEAEQEQYENDVELAEMLEAEMLKPRTPEEEAAPYPTAPPPVSPSPAQRPALAIAIPPFNTTAPVNTVTGTGSGATARSTPIFDLAAVNVPLPDLSTPSHRTDSPNQYNAGNFFTIPTEASQTVDFSNAQYAEFSGRRKLVPRSRRGTPSLPPSTTTPTFPIPTISETEEVARTTASAEIAETVTPAPQPESVPTQSEPEVQASTEPTTEKTKSENETVAKEVPPSAQLPQTPEVPRIENSRTVSGDDTTVQNVPPPPLQSEPIPTQSKQPARTETQDEEKAKAMADWKAKKAEKLKAQASRMKQQKANPLRNPKAQQKVLPKTRDAILKERDRELASPNRLKDFNEAEKKKKEEEEKRKAEEEDKDEDMEE